MYYCVLLGDLIGSKKIQPKIRNVVQIRLKALLNELNSSFSDYLISPFLVTLGDEFQGVLTAAEPAIEMMEYIDRGLLEYGAQMRYGIGVGPMTTPVSRLRALGDDGPAYHLARKGVDFLKQEKWKGFPVSIQTGRTDALLLRETCRLMNELVETWSSRQRQYILDMEVMGEQMLVASKNGIQQSTVSRALKRGHYKTYRQAKDSLKQYLLSVYDCPEEAGRLGRYNRAVSLLRNHRPEEAVQILKTLLDRETGVENPDEPPSLTDLLTVLASCYRSLRQYEPAVGAALRAIKAAEKQPDSRIQRINLYNFLGYCYLGLADNQERDSEAQRAYAGRARKALEAALPLCKEEPFLEAKLRGNLASAYGKMGDLSREIACRKELRAWMRDMHVENIDAEISNLHNLGGAYMQQGNRQRAFQTINEAVELADALTVPLPDIGRLYSLYGVLLDGNAPEARIRYFEKALYHAKLDGDLRCICEACQRLEPLYRAAGKQEAAEQCAEALPRMEKKLKKNMKH